MDTKQPQPPFDDFETSATEKPPKKAAGKEEAPKRIEPPPPPKPDQHGRMTAENWAAEKKTEPWQFAAVKAGKQWPEGKELTEKDYDAAIAWLDSEDCVCR